VIHSKYQHFVFAFFMALFMSCIMSFIISVFNIGFVSDIVIIWLQAWSFAFCVGFPVVLLVSPTVRRLVELVIINECKV